MTEMDQAEAPFGRGRAGSMRDQARITVPPVLEEAEDDHAGIADSCQAQELTRDELARNLALRDRELQSLRDRMDEMTERNERLQHELELLCDTRERVPSSAKDFVKLRKKVAMHSLADELGALDPGLGMIPESVSGPVPEPPAKANDTSTGNLVVQLTKHDAGLQQSHKLVSQLRAELQRALGDAIAADKELQQVYDVQERLEAQLHAYRQAMQRARGQNVRSKPASNFGQMPPRARSDSALGAYDRPSPSRPQKPPKPPQVPLLNNARSPAVQQQRPLVRSGSISAGLKRLGGFFSTS